MSDTPENLRKRFKLKVEQVSENETTLRGQAADLIRQEAEKEKLRLAAAQAIRYNAVVVAGILAEEGVTPPNGKYWLVRGQHSYFRWTHDIVKDSIETREEHRLRGIGLSVDGELIALTNLSRDYDPYEGWWKDVPLDWHNLNEELQPVDLASDEALCLAKDIDPGIQEAVNQPVVSMWTEKMLDAAAKAKLGAW
jgi:hypothetical protein